MGHRYAEISKRRIGWTVRIIHHVDRNREEEDGKVWRPSYRLARRAAWKRTGDEVWR